VVEDKIKAIEKISNGSTLHSIRSKAIRRLKSHFTFDGLPRKNRVLTVKKFTNGEIIQVELPWLIEQSSSWNNNKKIEEKVWAKILPGNIGLLRVNSMWAEEGDETYIKWIHSRLDLLQNTRAIIIDVRDNGGGSGFIGDAIISRFITKEKVRYKMSLRKSTQVLFNRPQVYETFSDFDLSSGNFTEWIDLKITPASTENYYSGTVTVLTNENCFSACDTFVDSFQSNGIGKVYGQQTGGGTGYPLGLKLPYGYGRFRFSVLRGLSNHGRLLEGIGTLPDVPLATKIEDLRQKRDGVLIETHRLLMEEIAEEKSLFDIEVYYSSSQFQMRSQKEGSVELELHKLQLLHKKQGF